MSPNVERLRQKIALLTPDDRRELFTDLQQAYPLRWLQVEETAPDLSDLREADKVKLEALRQDIQTAADSLDPGEGICFDSNFFTRNEGGICRRIRIEGNVFEDMAIHPDGVTLSAGFQSLNHAASTPLLSDLTVRGNRFINTGRHAIDFRLVSGGEISANTFTSTTPPRSDAWITTKQSKDIRTSQNQFPAGTTEMK